MIIGFSPLFLFIYFSKLRINKDKILNYLNFNLLTIFLILLSPVIIYYFLWVMIGADGLIYRIHLLFLLFYAYLKKLYNSR